MPGLLHRKTASTNNSSQGESRKNPLIVATLNFLIPGIGFIYLGTAPFIIGGFVLFIATIIVTGLTWNIFDSFVMLLSLVFACLWAILGLIATDYVNKSMQPSLPVKPLETLRIKPPIQPVTEDVSRPKKVVHKIEKRIHCIHCGEELPSHAAYCRKCGKKVE